MENFKRHIAILLGALLIFQSLIPHGQGFSKEFRAGEIVSHYLEHKVETKGDLTFWDFLHLHYSSDSNHREQNPDNLPDLDGNSTATFLILATNFGNGLLQIEPSGFFNVVHSTYSNTYCFNFAQELTHPPVI